MATSNRVFVSPGVYTSEKDLTFVAQSVGVTTLGLVGETTKGPAFEPILISNFDEFRAFFGPTSPHKDGNGNPKYELPYVSRAYLQQSNQLFITRILGLTGYRPNKTFGIKTLGGVNVDLETFSTTTGISLIPTSADISGSTIYNELSTKTSVDGTTITEYIIDNYGFLGATNVGDWFVIGSVPEDDTIVLTGDEIVSPLTGKLNEQSNHSKEWFNVFYNDGPTINKVYSYLFVFNGTSFDVSRYEYDATLNTEYDSIVVAALRSRGRYVGSTLTLEVTGDVVLSSNNLSSNPLAEFDISVTGLTGGEKTYTCSFDTSSSKYLTKVLGSDVFGKNFGDFPLYVHEIYPNFVKRGFDLGLIRGIDVSVVTKNEGDNFLTPWDTTISPTVVSEVRGGEVSDLFQIQTISDGESANFEVKMSIQNINVDTGEFDVLVRDFNDTDENPVVLEKFTRCSMNPDVPGYVGRKIGTSDGEYELRSKYVMLILSENHPTDAFPAGFKGFLNDGNFSGSVLGSVQYKTQYFNPGDVMYYETNGNPVLSNGDKVRRTSLGLSSQTGFDRDLLKFKGQSSFGKTSGFHLSKNASTITTTTYQTTPYDLEGTDKGHLNNASHRKFTFAVYGGFDGWDVYRNVRTFSDEFIFGKQTYIANHSTGGGVFSPVVGNSDYYAYLQGIYTFSNPEAVDINVFATPGINFFNHSSLTAQAIEMIELDRADSVYIISSPNVGSAEEVVDDLDAVDFDTNYSATYWPWIQVRDADNATQIYIPPTSEVVRNIALTDNVSYPWFSVAGYDRGLVRAIKASKKLTLDERDILYKNRINPIATFSDTGPIIWGNKTLQVRESALDRLNVRRLLLRARKLISAVAVRLIFDQNDEQVRNEFLRLVNPILEAIKKERGLNDFRVVVSNDPEDLDSNTLRGKIYINPIRSLEYVEVEFIVTPTGASFENI